MSDPVALLFSPAINPGISFLFAKPLLLHLLTTWTILLHTAQRPQTLDHYQPNTYIVYKNFATVLHLANHPLTTVSTRHTPPTPRDRHHRGEPTPEQQHHHARRGSSRTGAWRAPAVSPALRISGSRTSPASPPPLEPHPSSC